MSETTIYAAVAPRVPADRPAAERLRYPAIRRCSFSSALPAHHEVNPDRGKGGRATLRHGIVPIDSQLLANGDGPLAELGEVDADFRKGAVHRPLHDWIGGSHFGLDAIQQRWEVEPFQTLHDPLGGEAPSGACRP